MASAPLSGLWMRPFVYTEKLTRGSCGGSDNTWTLHRCDCRAGSSPSDTGVWCEMTPFSVCSCDPGCFCQPSAKLRAGEQGILGSCLGWHGHRGWPGRQAAPTFQGSVCTRETPQSIRDLCLLDAAPMGSMRHLRTMKAGSTVPLSSQLQALLRLGSLCRKGWAW